MLSKLLYFGPPLPALHEQYAKSRRVDRRAPLVSSSSIEIKAPVSAVWRVVVDVSSWPGWASGVEITQMTFVRPDERFKWKLNRVPIQAKFAVVDLERELSWTGQMLFFRAIDRCILEPIDNNLTRVTFEESLAGPLLPLLYSSSQLQKNHARWLTSLAIFLEEPRR